MSPASLVSFVHDGGEAAPSYDVEVSDGALTTGPAAATITFTNQNDAPVVDDQTIGPVDENSAAGTVVGAVVASDVDAGQSLTYAITGGNSSGAFAIDPGTGEITVANASALNFETAPTFALTVQVTDDATPSLSDTATVTINLNDMDEAPVLADAIFAVDENAANGTAVGTVPVEEPDANDTYSYAVVGGDPGGVFTIDNAGNLTVADGSQLDFEGQSSYTLSVQVSDDDGYTDVATITIGVNDLAETSTVVIDTDPDPTSDDGEPDGDDADSTPPADDPPASEPEETGGGRGAAERAGGVPGGPCRTSGPVDSSLHGARSHRVRHLPDAFRRGTARAADEPGPVRPNRVRVHGDPARADRKRAHGAGPRPDPSGDDR